ncbi:MAG: CDC48 family AAA ATPase [Candidatus Thermoplasmatota archaeon]
MSNQNKTFLKVKKAKTRDSGRGIARIDPKIAKKLNITAGDTLLIEGKKQTASIAWPGYPEDKKTESIRIDGATRRNAGVGIDEKVKIQKTRAQKASKITIAPTTKLKIVGGEEYLNRFLEGRAVTRGDLIELNVMGRKIDFAVAKLSGAGKIGIIDNTTQITISEKTAEEEIQKLPKITYEDIGGLNEEIKQVREMIELPLKHPELFEKMGVEAPKGVLLHGPPGTGKTLIAKAVANESNANFFSLSGPEIMSKYYGQSEENLRKIFKEATENTPSIIFIDELDSLAPKREDTQGDVERRVVAQMLAMMDGLEERGKVIVIGATNRVNALDPALRRPGRFDREIEIGIPDRKGRQEILEIHTRGMPLAKNVNLEKIADMTHGYSGADLTALSKEAAMRTLRKIMPNIDLDESKIPAKLLDKLEASQDDFYQAFKSLTPSAMREVVIESPKVKWQDIGGLEEIKEELKESVEWPIKYSELFEKMDAEPAKGILLYGPPGTGKTLLAKAVASESETNFISVKGPEFLSKWVGESEKAVRETFRKARQAAPCVIFFDEMDTIAPSRRGGANDSNVTERIISQLLTELDGLEELKDIVVIAATNRPDLIDTALLRPGRFDKLLYVQQPDKESRKEIFKIHLKNKPLAKKVDIDDLADKTKGYTGADIAALCKESVMNAIREYIKKVGKIDKDKMKKLKIEEKHLEKALDKIKPISIEELERYEKISEKFNKNR